MPPIVRLAEVGKAYGGLTVLERLSLAVEEGEFLTLLGPSGCGKTTTLRLISGFERPDRGTVEIGGVVVNDVPPFRRNVNTVFQNYALFPHLSIFENVAYGLTVKRRPRREIAGRVGEMLNRMELSDKADRFPSELSGGQMQRVALARALINEPSLLLLDEPLGALDAKLRKQMQVELKRTQERLGMTFLYVTHDQEEAMAMSDRIVVMERGRIEQIGAPRDIYRRPRSRFVASFIGSANFLRATVLSTDAGDLEVETAGGGRLHCRTDHPLAAGDPVEIFVRPEHARVEPAATGGPTPNSLPARLVEVIELGALRRHSFMLAGDQQVDVDILADLAGAVSDAACAGFRLVLPADVTLAFPRDAT